MAYVPIKRCDRLDKHEPDGHEWKENNVFRRWCPGRTVPKAPSRSRRKGHDRKQS